MKDWLSLCNDLVSLLQLRVFSIKATIEARASVWDREAERKDDWLLGLCHFFRS